MELIVSIEKDGQMSRVGSIRGTDSSDACFCYDSNYLHSPTAMPISISLPLWDDPYSPEQTAIFFEGLLPEGFTRRSVAQWMHVDESDYLSILHGLGRECIGALCITEAGEEPISTYEEITEQQIRDLAAEGATKSAELVTKSHLSLTGASGKVGLYYDKNTEKWFLPQGTAPSTHIIKQSHIRLDAIVTNEQLSLMTAARCGIHIPHSFIINTGNGNENEILFATERYDRKFPENPAHISGLARPLRLHQEDFAQAMGIPATAKYEHTPNAYMQKMFDLLRIYSSDPIADQLQLWDMIIFDYLIGNTDAHIKNFSLLYSDDLRQIRLAPAYDIVSTVVYEQSTREMAFRIGEESSIEDITEKSFQDAAKKAGLGERMAMRRYVTLCERFRPALLDSAAALSADGNTHANELAERILECGGIHYYMSQTGTQSR